MRAIHRYSKGYQLVRSWVKLTLCNLFFRKVSIRGLEKIDPKRPIILAPNHQNALVDALITATSLKQQPVFLARADIFEKDAVESILRWMKMLPVYRIRDGFDSLKKNEDIFNQCVDYLKTKNTLILFPEGNHGDKRRLRPLKKGLARIAFEAEKKNNFQLGLQIIPVGIDYSDYRKFRGRVSIIFGDPIEMKDLEESYRDNPQKGLRSLNMRIEKGIGPIMIEIPWEEFYDDVMNIRIIYGDRFHHRSGTGKKRILDRFDSHKKLISVLGELIENNREKALSLAEEVRVYFALLRKLRFRDHVTAGAPYSVASLILKSIGMLIGWPLYIYGMLNNYLIFKLPEYYTLKRIKDTQFRSSIAYVLAFVLMLPVLYIIQTILVGVFTHSLWIALAYLVSLVPAGLFAINYSFWFKKLWSGWKFTILKAGKSPEIASLLKLRQSIVESLDEITS